MTVKEPLSYTAVVAALGSLAVHYGFFTPMEIDLWTALIVVLVPLLQGFFSRRFALPRRFLRKAGIDPKEVEEIASKQD